MTDSTSPIATLADALQSIRDGIDAEHRVRDRCQCLGCDTWAPIGHPEAHSHADDCPEIARVMVERNTRGRLDALITELRASPPAPAAPSIAGWQPIETALKDVSVMLYAGRYVPMYCGRLRAGQMGEPSQDTVAWRCDSSGRFANPTHWMPLPVPPGVAAPAIQPAHDFDAYELEYMNKNPEALAMLMDYHDFQQDQADSMGAETTGDAIRVQQLKERGRSIMVADLDLYSDDLRKRFGFPPYRAAIDAARLSTGDKA